MKFISDEADSQAEHDFFKNFVTVGFLAGLLGLLFVSSLFVVPSYLFFHHLSISPWVFYLSLAVAIGSWLPVALLYGNTQMAGKAFLFFLIALTASLALSLFYFDVSYDGQAYHQEAVIQLARGWNPVYETLHSGIESEKWSFLWNNHYPKAAEISEACFYKLAGRIESGKTINFLMIFSSFWIFLFALVGLRAIRLRWAALLSSLAALNPVVICQSATFYLDGVQASFFLCLCALLCIFYFKPNKFLGVALIAASLYFINTKFTAVLTFGILAAGFLAAAIFNQNRQVFKKALWIFVLSFVVGIFVTGYNPYVKNYLQKGHPFYPLMGEEKIDIMKGDRPFKLYPMNSVERFLVSLFSESTIQMDSVKIKISFFMKREEAAAFFYPDVRLAGFGPLFGGVFILTLALLIGGLKKFIQRKVFWILIFFVFVSVFLNPEAWWLRYVSQFWLVPVLALFISFSGRQTPVEKYLAIGTAFFMVLNVLLVAIPYVYGQTKASHAVRWELRELSREAGPIKVNFNLFRSNRVRLEEYSIPYEEVRESPKGAPVSFVGSEAKMWMNK